MKMIKFAAIAATAAALTGCQTSMNSVPSAGSPQVSLAPMKTNATYEVIGDAVGTSKGSVLFGIFTIEGEGKSGSVGGGLASFAKDPVKDAAIYNAIESVKGADSIIAPRTHREVTNWIVYKEETVTVKGKAIRIK